MKLPIITLVTALGMASSAAAQTTATSQSGSNSLSQSGVTVEGANVPNNTPGLGGMVGSAGNCYPGGGIQAVGPGAGFSIGGGRVDPECNTRMEMAALASVAGNTVAVAHACKHDRSMRATLVELGYCRVAGSDRNSVGGRASDVTTGEAQPTTSRASTAPSGLLECSSARIRISSRLDAVERQRAINWCKDQVAARR